MILANAFVEIIQEYGITFLYGIGITLLLSLTGTVIGLMLAFVFCVIRQTTVKSNDNALMKVLKKAGHAFVNIYVTVIRGTPMIVQAVIFYYGFYQIGIRWSSIAAGLFTVSINTTAYLTEVLRSGIESVDVGQKDAALAIGMKPAKAFSLVVFPQALKNSFSSIGNEFIVNIKDTAVLSTIMVVDLFAAAVKAQGATLAYLESMTIAALCYLILTYSVSKILMVIEKRIGAPIKQLPSCNWGG